MKNVTQHEGILEDAIRLETSKNGNPRYLLSILEPGGVVRAKTMVDSSYAYEIPALVGKRVQAWIGRHYGTQQVDRIRLVRYPR